ncbi:cell wall protein [Microbacterium sp. EYE_5]|uniref:cell wall protein n=1 Tax=unclassified Microbacterium TaxID=2609290 RepID=UPI002003C7D7|nr:MULTISPECIES: cell wall protein [unclassified Microbacterium]MCK6079063.1 cell wall protein [Microbacterium sp. EYE_382]MCK6084333.1 cell wall protein [Microbacterium sp. EYE_384]MCK6123438.1 cell wall protein [Microbacterium sp. EYE_80]MCK6125097.1 cell wall protein [Microbacterium sp. EYE_79]MCK6140017.1 cell wall protein [Microbacterium sp. EYE_39]
MRRTTLPLSAALLAAALVGAPAVAQASTIYPPVDACSSTAQGAGPGDTIAFSCEANSFAPNESVTVTVTGENGAGASFGMLRTEVSTASTVSESDADGALPEIAITLPSDARGVYNIAAVSASSAGGTASAVIDASQSDDVLVRAGFDGGQLMGLWVGAGALLAAGVVVVVAAALRRHRAQNDD